MKQTSIRCSNAVVRQMLRNQHTTAAGSASKERPLFLDPHKWIGLPADRVFELHNLRVNNLGEKYNPCDDERKAILSTFKSLAAGKLPLEYGYELDNFKERIMNNTPSNLRGLPPKISNKRVFDKGETPHKELLKFQKYSLAAFEMPLLAKFRQPYVPPTKSEPIKLTYRTDFSDNASEFNSKVTLSIKLKDLKLKDAEAKKFMLLADEKFNHNTKKLIFSSSKFPESTQNARWLVETLNTLVKESKDLTKNTFEDIPVNTRQSKAVKPKFNFPEEWKRPQDAPLKRHNIVQAYVQSYKEKMDKEFIHKLSP